MEDKKQELISIIIPVYRVEKYLKRCIETVINQTYKNIEIILVDDGSDDSCPQICDKYMQKDNRIKVIHQENEGLQIARENGVEASHGNLIFFIDSDDYIEIDTIEFLYNEMIEYEADMSIAGHYIEYSAENKKIFYSKRLQDKPLILEGDDKLLTLLEAKKFQAHLWNKLMKKELIKNTSSKHKKVYEDLAISYKLFDKAKRIVFCNQPKYHYIKNLNSILNSDFSERKMCFMEICENIINYTRENKSKKVIHKAISWRDRMYICTANDIANKYKIKHKKFYDIVCKDIRENIVRILFKDKLDIKYKIAAILLTINPRVYVFLVQMMKKGDLKKENAKK